MNAWVRTTTAQATKPGVEEGEPRVRAHDRDGTSQVAGSPPGVVVGERDERRADLRDTERAGQRSLVAGQHQDADLWVRLPDGGDGAVGGCVAHQYDGAWCRGRLISRSLHRLRVATTQVTSGGVVN